MTQLALDLPRAWPNDRVLLPWQFHAALGAGFWDGDYEYKDGADDGDYLTELSGTFGNVDLYIGGDGKVYAMGKENTWS